MSESLPVPFSRLATWWITLSVLMMVAGLLAICAPAHAITFGQPDGTAHPFVGSMVVSIPGEGVFQ